MMGYARGRKLEGQDLCDVMMQNKQTNYDLELKTVDSVSIFLTEMKKKLG